MGTASPRRKKLRDLFSNASDAIDGLDTEHEELAPDNIKRLEKVLSYARVVVEDADLDLVPGKAVGQIEASLTQIAEQCVQDPPGFVQTHSPNHANNLGEWLSRFPPSGEANTETIAEVLESARARARQQLEELRDEISILRSEKDELGEQVAAKDDELRQLVDGKKAELDQFAGQLSTKIDDEASRIEAARTEHEEHFRKAQEERDKQAEAQRDAMQAELGEFLGQAKEQTSEAVKAAEEALEEAKGAQGALGLKGTAERYRDEADKQGRAADAWRIGAVAFALLAVVAAVWAARSSDADTHLLIGRLAIGVVLGGLATYAAGQSGRHRNREEDTREIALDLAAFNSFIEPLSKQEEKDRDRRELGKRVFGQQLAARNRNKQAGPGLVEQVSDIVKDVLRREQQPPSGPDG